MTIQVTIQEKVKAVNEVLQKGEPHNFSADHKGYTGYKPQHIIDAVNTKFMGEWKSEVLEHHTYPTKNKKGEEVKNAFVKVRVTIADKSHDAFASHPILDDVGDAFKSAQTDAMKKALSHWSIGRRAYLGELEANKK